MSEESEAKELLQTIAPKWYLAKELILAKPPAFYQNAPARIDPCAAKPLLDAASKAFSEEFSGVVSLMHSAEEQRGSVIRTRLDDPNQKASRSVKKFAAKTDKEIDDAYRKSIKNLSNIREAAEQMACDHALIAGVGPTLGAVLAVMDNDPSNAADTFHLIGAELIYRAVSRGFHKPGEAETKKRGEDLSTVAAHPILSAAIGHPKAMIPNRDNLPCSVGSALSLAARNPALRHSFVALFKSSMKIMDWGGHGTQMGFVAYKASEHFRHTYASLGPGLDDIFDSLPVGFWIGLKRDVSFESKSGRWLAENLSARINSMSKTDRMATAKVFWLGMDKRETALLESRSNGILESSIPHCCSSSWSDGLGSIADSNRDLWSPKGKWIRDALIASGGPCDKESFENFSRSAAFSSRMADALSCAIAMESAKALSKAAKTAKALSKASESSDEDPLATPVARTRMPRKGIGSV